MRACSSSLKHRIPAAPIPPADPGTAGGARRVDFDWRWMAVPLALACVLTGLESTDIDRMVERWFYDPLTASFPLRHTFLLDTVLHHWSKYLAALLTCLAVGAWVLSYVVSTLASHRRLLLFLALSLALAPATVSALKFASAKHCPWNIYEFGGMVPYTRLLGDVPPSIKPGHCFPAGHASTGFTLMAFYFAGRSRKRRDLAAAGLAVGLTLGMVLGAGRMAQGAHFLTHTLWSGLVCWGVALLLYVVILSRGQGKPFDSRPGLRGT